MKKDKEGEKMKRRQSGKQNKTPRSVSSLNKDHSLVNERRHTKVRFQKQTKKRTEATFDK